MNSNTQQHRHFINTTVAGFTYWDGPIVFSDLHIGSQLNFVREADNRFDPYAVALYFGGNKIGFLPRSENKEISKLIDQGWDDVFEVCINRITADETPENQVGIVVYVKQNKQKEK